MNRRQWMMLSGAAAAAGRGAAWQSPAAASAPEEGTPDKLLLKNYRPVSIYKVPVHELKRAKFPIVDAHCHGIRPPQQVEEMVRLMDAVNVEKIVLFTGAATPDRFREISQPYLKYPGRFDPWCMFDFTGPDEPGYSAKAVKALEACHELGAMGVGEISDKGRGFGSVGAGGRLLGGRGIPANRPFGPHPDDPRVDPLFEKCAQLGMPVNIHVSDPIWAYEAMDKTNDGLPNGYVWRIKLAPGILGHNELIESLENTVRKHPKTMFIACHLANLSYDLARLGQMFDRHPNLYGDISARFGDLAPVPRASAAFFEKYQDRVLYGTDMAYTQRMFTSTFRIMETLDEHFYEFDLDVCYDYHWPLHGFGLADGVLRKMYADNMRGIYARAHAAA
jgi:hypothetical protein